MSTVYSIKKGLDINLLGEAEKTVVDLDDHLFAVKPTDFHDCFPKILAQDGDKVKAGSPLFMDKYRSEIIFTSPVSGTLKEVKRGAKRKILEIIVESDGKHESLDFGAADISKAGRDEIVEKLLKSGVWPVIRQRPYSLIANPKDEPKSIFVPAFESGPMAPDYDLLLHNHGQEFQAGLDILKKLTPGKVYLNAHAKKTFSKVVLNAKNVEINSFQGPHPVGNVSVHISRLDPINKGDIVWYVNPQDVMIIGRLFLTGKYDASKMIALTGSEIKRPKYYKIYKGASIEKMVENNVSDGEIRYISGNVLTGNAIEKDGFVGYYDNQVTVIPEGTKPEFLGWLWPGFGKFSLSRTFPKINSRNKKYRLDTNMHGGKRAYVMTSVYEKVFPFDIFPILLIKAILVEDIDSMENLGIYEIDEEDFALCEVVDVSKTDIQQIVRNGLDFIRKEMS